VPINDSRCPVSRVGHWKAILRPRWSLAFYREETPSIFRMPTCRRRKSKAQSVPGPADIRRVKSAMPTADPAQILRKRPSQPNDWSSWLTPCIVHRAFRASGQNLPLNALSRAPSGEVKFHFTCTVTTNRDLTFGRYNLRDDESPDTSDSLVCCNCKIRQD